MTSDKRWSEHENTYIQFMEDQCRDLYKKNMTDYEYYTGLAQRFNIPIIALSAVNSLSAIILNQFVDQVWVSLVNSILSASIGVAGSIQLYLKVSDKMTTALRSAMSFNKISLKIAKELATPLELRTTDGQTFVSECFAEFMTTVEQGNPSHISVHHLSTKKAPPSKSSGFFDRLFALREPLLSDYSDSSSV